MVQATPAKPAAVARSHQKIVDAIGNNDAMDANNASLDLVSRTLAKMPGRNQRANVESTVDVLFEIAAGKMSSDADREVLNNLRKYVTEVNSDMYRPKPRYLDAFFFPNKQNVQKIVRYIKMAKKSLLICVFNLTNDDLANAVKSVHEQGVDVRVITDDECMTNKGNDCQALANAGIPVRTDHAENYHMHNKYMIVDGAFLMTGSFNWTFQAGSHNQENLLVVDHPFYIERYTTNFEELWTQFADDEVRAQERAAKVIQKQYRNKQANQQNRANNTGGSRPAKSQSAPGYKFQGW